MALQHCRVVLIETLYPGNLGATARVMRNFGLTDLVLVNPVADKNDRRARRLSTHGERILDNARVAPDFGAAVADCVLVAGTSAHVGGLFRKQSAGMPHEIMPRLAEALGEDRPAALVFGTEPDGLPNEIVTRCHHLVQIPASPEYPSFNLAQAVAICLYELHQAWLGRHSSESKFVQAASFESQERMYQQLRDGLEQIHFLFGEKADALMHGIRHLLGKARLTDMEVKLLLGLARQMRWIAAQAKLELAAQEENKARDKQHGDADA